MNHEARTAGRLHLTYCTNIHSGESWAEVRNNLERYVVAVKRAVSPDAPFGIGLRLSGRAAAELEQEPALAEFASFLADHDLYVFTINGFPHGAFHGTRVKENVYRPDWLEQDRLEYSNRLARILARLLPDEADLEGTVSTVPGAFRERAGDRSSRERIADALLRHAATLSAITRETGRTISLALEPEPHCLLETTADAVAFFEEHLLTASARAHFASLSGEPPARAEESIRRHLGVCLDACHAAIEFEDPSSAVGSLRAAGIRVGKIQVSTGLRARHVDAEARRSLAAFADDVYLHQVVERRGSVLTRHLDLPDALAALESDDTSASLAREWRIHFHVPVFLERLDGFENTQAFLAELLAIQACDPISDHLEAETYTWDVLPERYRTDDVVAAVARELVWIRERLADPGASA